MKRGFRAFAGSRTCKQRVELNQSPWQHGAGLANGAVAGSRAIEMAEGRPESAARYVASLRAALDSAA
jgi:hypothetical protein